jgi:hypothetical protein
MEWHQPQDLTHNFEALPIYRPGGSCHTTCSSISYLDALKESVSIGYALLGYP